MFWVCIILLGIGFLLWLCQFGKVGIAAAIILVLLTIHAWLCSTVWWYGTKVVPPEISLSLDASRDLDPLLGEAITQDDEGNYRVNFVYHQLDNPYSAPKLNIKVTPAEASLAKGNYHFYINNQDLGLSQTIRASSDYKIITDYTIASDDVNLDTDHSDGTATPQTAKYIIKVSNVAGTAEKTLFITRYLLSEACANYNQAHYQDNSNNGIAACEKLLPPPASTEPAPSTPAPAEPKPSTPAPSAPSGSSSSRPNTDSSCLHFEANRCWDDLELEIYDQGLYDKAYGRYGDGYYEPDDCDESCQDILMDAYDEGYYDY